MKFVERFHRTLLDEHFPVMGRTQLDESVGWVLAVDSSWYPDPGGKTERLCREIIANGKPLFTTDCSENTNVIP